MAVPWLGLLDTLVDITRLALSRTARRPSESLAVEGRTPGHLETRLTGLVAAAVKDAFDRETGRLELEREQIERERLRAERLLNLELLGQAGDREIGRLRLMAGVAVVSWIGTLFFSTRLIGGAVGARVMLGSGWLLLLAALSLSFAAQSRVSRVLARIDEPAPRSGVLITGAAGLGGAMVPWLIVVGLAAVGVAVWLA